MNTRPSKIFAVIRFAMALTLSCAAGCQLIAPFSEEAYRQATSLKVESLELMDRAVQPFADHANEVAALRTQIQKAYEYAAGRAKNDLSTKQWAIIMDPDRRLVGGFLKLWESEGQLSKVFIQEAKGNVSEAFDHLIGLESGKIKSE